MSTMSLSLPESLHQRARELAQREGISINQLIATALAEKISALDTIEYLEARAARGSRKAFRSDAGAHRRADHRRRWSEEGSTNNNASAVRDDGPVIREGRARASLVTARDLVDTNVLSEPVRKEPDDAVVDKLREHGGELPTASIVWHEMIFGVRSLPRSRRHTAIERYLAEVIAAGIPHPAI